MKTLTTTIGLTMILAAVVGSARGDDEKNSQQAKSFEKEITIKVKLNYLLYLPEGYESSNRQWPLVLFLHGAGQTGENVERVKAAGLPGVLGKDCTTSRSSSFRPSRAAAAGIPTL